MTVTLILGDFAARMVEIEAGSIDAVVTDPPYHLTTAKKGGSGDASVNPNSPAGRAMIGTGFMGKEWDGGDVAFRVETWREVFRVLKPGAHLVAFGGTRTYHRMVCAIEDAGFEIRDQLQWLYGSGFPKSHNISKALDRAAGAERAVLAEGKPVKRMIPGADQDATGSRLKNGARTFTPTETAPATEAAEAWRGWGTALKPACEPIVLARKPLSETSVAANVLRWGTGALNIDGCRVTVEDAAYIRNCSGDRGHAGTRDEAGEGATSLRVGGGRAAAGRWPANVIHDGSDEVIEQFPAQAGAAAPVRRRNGDKFRNTFGAFAGNIDEAGSTFQGDSGSAARFFYCAKASGADRDDGLDDLPLKPLVTFQTANGASGKPSSISAGRDTQRKNTHPTVKPTALMRWLVRLVTPPGGKVLDPFMGSGSTGRGCVLEGLSFVGIEREAEYIEIARGRIAAAEQTSIESELVDDLQLSLFEGGAYV